jgi:hypothetical protein
MDMGRKVHLPVALSRTKLRYAKEENSRTSATDQGGRQVIAFKNLIVGRHESRVLFAWSAREGVALLGAFRAIHDGVEAILNRDEITPALRVTLEEFRALAGQNDWNFVTLRESLVSA